MGTPREHVPSDPRKMGLHHVPIAMKRLEDSRGDCWFVHSDKAIVGSSLDSHGVTAATRCHATPRNATRLPLRSQSSSHRFVDLAPQTAFDERLEGLGGRERAREGGPDVGYMWALGFLERNLIRR